jgi:P-type Ca2+ transporter type 2C
MSVEQLQQAVSRVTVFARITPEHKMRIIEAYKRRGEIIAMTGDGVNDAPPLVAADLGVAMGKIGTEVAREAADIILLDDNFGSIISAVEEGRTMYRKIQKTLLFLFSTSIGEVLTIAGAIALDIPIPLSAAQILWLNLVTDSFVAFALAMDTRERKILVDPEYRTTRFLINSRMAWRMILMAFPIALGTLWLFLNTYETDLLKAWTISLTVLAVFQWLNGWNCRSETESAFRRPFENKYLLVGVACAAALQVLALYWGPLSNILNTTPLDLSEWGLIIAVAFSIVAVEETRKYFARRKKSVLMRAELVKREQPA